MRLIARRDNATATSGNRAVVNAGRCVGSRRDAVTCAESSGETPPAALRQPERRLAPTARPGHSLPASGSRTSPKCSRARDGVASINERPQGRSSCHDRSRILATHRRSFGLGYRTAPLPPGESQVRYERSAVPKVGGVGDGRVCRCSPGVCGIGFGGVLPTTPSALCSGGVHRQRRSRSPRRLRPQAAARLPASTRTSGAAGAQRYDGRCWRPRASWQDGARRRRWSRRPSRSRSGCRGLSGLARRPGKYRRGGLTRTARLARSHGPSRCRPGCRGSAGPARRPGQRRRDGIARSQWTAREHRLARDSGCARLDGRCRRRGRCGSAGPARRPGQRRCGRFARSHRRIGRHRFRGWRWSAGPARRPGQRWCGRFARSHRRIRRHRSSGWRWSAGPARRPGKYRRHGHDRLSGGRRIGRACWPTGCVWGQRCSGLHRLNRSDRCERD